MELTPEVNDLYRRLITEVNKFGEITVEEKKTSFHIKGGAAFAGVHPRKQYFILNIVSAAPIKSARVVEQEQVSAHRLFFASRNSPLLQNIFPGTGGEN
jgi:hypothetical protein